MNLSLKEFLRYELKSELTFAEAKWLEKLSNNLEDESNEQEQVIAELTRSRDLIYEQLDFARAALVEILDICNTEVSTTSMTKKGFVAVIKACIEESHVDL